jgi:serine/threonine-protein kinase
VPITPHEASIAERERRRRRWPWFALGLLVLLLAGLLVFLAAGGAGKKVEVPRVVGTQVLVARDRLEKAGFEVRETRAPSTEELGKVVDQDPNPGEEAKKGSTVTLEVSQGPGNVRVPAVENLPERQAIKELNDAGLRANVDSESSDSVRRGIAIRTVPGEGVEVQRDGRVRLLVSSGPKRISVPDVVGLSRESAEGRLRDEGLGVVVQETESDKPQGEVITQTPSGGSSVSKGARVTITISQGQPKVDVPDVTGLSAGSAAARLRAAGLVPVQQKRSTSNQDEDGQVLDQRPGGGSQVDKGRSVVIVVGKFKQPAQTTPQPTPVPAPAPGTLTP